MSTAKQLQSAEFQAPAVQSSLSPLVQAAMSGQLDTEKLKELLQIQKDYEANEARKAFHVALSEFKKRPLTIYKDKHVHYTSKAGITTDYRHATLGGALEEINPALGEHGLSLTWETKQGDGGRITVTCVLSHSMGHSITTSLSGSPDDSGGKNNIQAVGSTVEYLKRYTAFALLGISSKDADDDGRGASVERISEEQAANIQALLDELVPENKRAAFFGYWKISRIEDISAQAYKDVVASLERKRRQ